MSTKQTAAALPTLSERELEVLKLVATGATNNQIARELSISVNTVKVHLNNIFTKLGVQSRTEAALYAVRQGWIVVERPGAASSLSPAESQVVSIASSPPAQTAPLLAVQPSPPVVIRPRRPFVSRRVVVPALIAGLLLLGAFVFSPLRESLSAPTNNLIVPPPIPTPERWHTRAPLASPREAMAVAVVDGLIYVIGGLSEGHTLVDVNVYDSAKDTWSSKANKPTAAQGHGAAVLGGRIYAPGGCDAQDQPSDAMEVYDPASDHWQTSTPLPQAICHYAISVLEGKLYVFGGWDGSRAVASVFAFDPVRGEWTEQAALPEPRADAAAAVANEHIYVVGGRVADHLLSDALLFDPTQDRSSGKSWSAKAPLLHPRARLGLVALAGNLYAMGGGWSSALTENERYDAKANKWSPMEASPETLWQAGGAGALETKLYLFGGSNNQATASVQEYTALYRSFLPDVSPR